MDNNIVQIVRNPPHTENAFGWMGCECVKCQPELYENFKAILKPGESIINPGIYNRSQEIKRIIGGFVCDCCAEYNPKALFFEGSGGEYGNMIVCKDCIDTLFE